nr:stage III sporulation protein AB [uncultured Oscillibacter sp.]
MLKVLGSACILGGGILARYLQAAERRREMDTLSDLLWALRRMAEEIRMARTPLPLLLERLSQGCGETAGAFFREVSAAARRGENLGDAWRQAAETLPGTSALTELGDGLCGDEESVCKAISLVIYSLAQDLEERTRRQPEEAKRATALCLSGAALLVILLI